MANNTALAVSDKKALAFRKTLADNLVRIKSALVGTKLSEARLCAMAMNTLQQNPALLECDPQSFALAILSCAEMGLEPGGALHQVALIPRKGIVTVQPEYRGLLQLARNSGEISMIYAEVVHEGDSFTYTRGLEPTLVHTPGDDTADNPWTHVYAVAKLKDGGTQFEVLTKQQVYRLRDRSQNVQVARQYKKKTPWDTDETEMAKKTAIRRLVKCLPASVEDLRRAVYQDERADIGQGAVPSTIELIPGEAEMSFVEETQHGTPDKVRSALKNTKPTNHTTPDDKVPQTASIGEIGAIKCALCDAEITGTPYQVIVGDTTHLVCNEECGYEFAEKAGRA